LQLNTEKRDKRSTTIGKSTIIIEPKVRSVRSQRESRADTIWNQLIEVSPKSVNKCQRYEESTKEFDSWKKYPKTL